MNIARNSTIIFVAKILLSFFTFATAIVIARVLGPRGLGTYSLFLAVIGLAVNMGSLGIGNASLYLLNRGKRDINILFSNALVAGVLGGLIIGGILFTLSILFPYTIFSLPVPYFFLGLVIVPSHILHIYLLQFFMARFDVYWWSFFSILYTVLVFFGTLGALFLFGLGVFGAVLAIAFSSVLLLLLLLFVLWKRYDLSFRLQLGTFKEQLHFGLRSYIGELFNTIHFKLNTFLASFFVAIVAIGHFSVALNMASILFFIPFSLQQVLNPLWSSKALKEVDAETPKTARHALIIGVVISFAFFFIAKPFILLLFGESFLPALFPFLLLLPGFVAFVFAGIFFTNFFARGMPQLTSLILIATLLLNVALNFFLIPRMGIDGAALAISISLLVALIFAVLTFAKITQTPLWEIVIPKLDDIRSLGRQFQSLLHTKKLMPASNLSLEYLREYYEKKGKEDVARILHGTFESPSLFKRMFYALRTRAIMEALDLKREERVLEIGCGVGYYTKKIAQHTPRVVATDIAESFLEFAKKNNPYPIEQYVACPVEKLPFENNTFDKVLMSEVIEHLMYPEQGVREIQRVLKPGGKAVIATPNTNSYLNLLYHIRLLFSGTQFDQDHIHEFSGKELENLLGKYFAVKQKRYVNYFPVLLPRFLGNMIGLQRIQIIVQFLESFFNHIPVIGKAGFSMVFQVQKQ